MCSGLSNEKTKNENKKEPVWLKEYEEIKENFICILDGKLWCICKRKFDDEFTFITHIQGEEELYYCHHCNDFKKITKHKLLQHYKQHGIEVKGRNFFRDAKAKKPRKEFKRKLFCEICPETFEDKEDLERHYKQYHANHYRCEVCDASFSKIIELTCHMQTHDKDGNFKCPVCPFTTKVRHIIRSHLGKAHELFMLYKCEICFKGFRSVTQFKEHINYYHKGETPFECDICSKKFTYSINLHNHKMRQHQNNDSLVCPICGAKLGTVVTLNQHYKKHVNEKMVCDVCAKTFSTKNALNCHYRTHTGEKNYQCSRCSKRFTKRKGLREHERIHTGEKPYQCPHCDKRFAQRSPMVIHARIHTGEKPYVCHICNRGYRSKNMLTNHLKACKGKPVSSESEEEIMFTSS